MLCLLSVNTNFCFICLSECAMQSWNMSEEEGSGSNETCSNGDWENNSTNKDVYNPHFSAVVGPHFVCDDYFCGLRALSFRGPKKDGWLIY